MGGRTSAYVVELQRLLRDSASQKPKKVGMIQAMGDRLQLTLLSQNVDSSQSTSPETETETVRTTRKQVKKVGNLLVI